MWALGREEGKVVANSEFAVLREELRVFELGGGDVSSVNSEIRDLK